MKTINFEKFEVNEEQHSIVFSCASDLPYTRYSEHDDFSYDEILTISEDAVDLHRLNDGASVLFNHDTDKLLGTVQKAWIVENKIYVKAKFSKNDEFAKRIYQDIIDGVIKNVSIGYSVEKYEDKKENDVYKRYVTRWMIFQVSIVAVPADETVGFRQLNIKEIKTMKKNKKECCGACEKPMEEEVKEEVENVEVVEEEVKECGECENKPTEEVKEENADVAELKAQCEELKKRVDELEAQAEQKEEDADAEEEVKEDAPVDNTEKENETEIKAIGRDFNISDAEIREAINSKMTVRDFKTKIKTFNINKKENKNMENSFRDYLNAKDFEKPYMLRDYTGFGGQTGEGGAGLIGTTKLPLVQALVKRMGLRGFRTLAGLNSQITIPVQTTRHTVGIKDFHAGADASNPAFTNKTLSAHLVTGMTRVGKDLLLESSDDVEAFVIDSLTKEIAYKIQDYMLGKVTAAAATTVTYSALSAITWADVLAMEANLGGYMLNPEFVMSASARAALKGTSKDTGSGRFICEDNNVNGYFAGVSGCVTNDNIYFGDWSKLILATWKDGLEITVDPYTYADNGDVRIVARIGIDACVEDGNAFTIGKVQSSSSESSSSESSN